MVERKAGGRRVVRIRVLKRVREHNGFERSEQVGSNREQSG